MLDAAIQYSYILSYNTIGKHFLIFEPRRKKCFLTFDPDQDHVFSTNGRKTRKS